MTIHIEDEDCEQILLEIQKQRDKAKSKGEQRAAAALDWVLELFAKHEKKEPKHKYGEFQHVLLSDKDFAKIVREYPKKWERLIREVDEYCEKTGKKYKNYLVMIRNWARREEKKNMPAGESSFDTDDFFELALRRTHGTNK